MTILSLNELVPGASASFTMIDGVQYLSICDIIMVMCDKNGEHAGQLLRNLKENNKNELQQFLANFKFPGHGQSEQLVITCPDAVRLCMFLPGETANNVCRFPPRVYS